MWNGVISRAELEMNGFGRRQISDLMANGDLQRISKGWYAWRNADPEVVLAAAANARLGCLSACRYHGLWVPEEKPSAVHVLASASESAARIKDRIRWASRGTVTPIVHRACGDKQILVEGLAEALEHVARFHNSELALIALESALNLERVSTHWIEWMVSQLPVHRARQLTDIQPLSQSGSETRVAHFLRNRGLPVIQQFSPLPGMRVDMCVGSSWILECDSHAHHASIDAFESDRTRDLALKEAGFDVTRLSYWQIWHDWDNTKKALVKMANRRRYMRRRPR
ncbi:hypothetical protein [Trueperella pecoris]|uniref:DUF559 domain-containing protein n=1 Tax=Trueperella pecoris TaxID=2733571 RepID=A0A7M1QUL6_9ACTO|nr:hypothetical protein [Trueperella pecoris]QOR45491.1 hypothetical protein INS88_09575 [Trueperella pecoris]